MITVFFVFLICGGPLFPVIIHRQKLEFPDGVRHGQQTLRLATGIRLGSKNLPRLSLVDLQLRVVSLTRIIFIANVIEQVAELRMDEQSAAHRLSVRLEVVERINLLLRMAKAEL